MQTISKLKGETMEDFVRRVYTVRNQYGYEDLNKIERAIDKVREANPSFEDLDAVQVPKIEGIPLLIHLIVDKEQLHSVVHEVLGRVQENPTLQALSFIDPIRVGVEELGIAAVPEVVAEVRARLEGHVSFDQERYEEVRHHGASLRGITKIQWTPKRR